MVPPVADILLQSKIGELARGTGREAKDGWQSTSTWSLAAAAPTVFSSRRRRRRRRLRLRLGQREKGRRSGGFFFLPFSKG